MKRLTKEYKFWLMGLITGGGIATLIPGIVLFNLLDNMMGIIIVGGIMSVVGIVLSTRNVKPFEDLQDSKKVKE